MSIINNIKKVSALVVALVSLSVAYASEARTEANAEWQRAIEAYSNHEYGVAKDALERVVELGYGSAEVYYNLANAYYKLGFEGDTQFGYGELGRAVLNYRRAMRLDPTNDDVRYNLDLAVDHTNDAESLPQGVLSSMLAGVSGLMTSNGWATASLVQFVMALILVLLYLLSNTIILRKVAFFVAIALFCTLVLSTIFALWQRSLAEGADEAVVVCNSVTSVHASPDNTSKVIRQPSQGVTIKVLRSHGEWSEIEFADGEKGWIPSGVIEMV